MGTETPPLRRDQSLRPAPTALYSCSAAPTTAAAAPTTAATASAAPAANTKPGKNNSKNNSARAKGIPPTAPPGSQAFQRADVNASGDGAKPPADAAANSGIGEATPANNSDGFLVNGSVNNGAASPFAQASAFGNNRRLGRSLYNGNVGFVFGNSALDARSFSLTGQDTAKPAYNHLQGVFSYGGPLKLPKQPLKQNAPNFVINYQLGRNRNATTNTYLMPTLLERNGDFSQSKTPAGQPLQLIDPTTGLPVAGNQVPQNFISSQATSLLRFFPLPNFASSRYNYQVPITSIGNSDNLQTRVSKTINNKNQVFGSFAWQRSNAENPNLFSFVDTTDVSGIDFTAELVAPFHHPHVRHFPREL